MQARDTHFADFANLLMREIDEQVGAVAEWGLARDSSQAEIGRELYSRWRTIIAQRAYDLLYFLLDNAPLHSGSFDVGYGSPDEIHETIAHLPKLTAWPERE